MYRIKDIVNALVGVCGWEQSYNPSNYIDLPLTQTESGLYFQDAHPLLTLKNMRSVMPDDWGMQYSAWNQLLEYRVGNKVRHNNITWICTRDNTGQEPTASDFNNDYSKLDYGNPFWKPYNMLSEYLQRVTENGVKTVVQTFVQEKQLEKETSILLERKTFFDGAGRIKHTTENTGKLVGFELNPVRTNGVTGKIERVGLQMTGATGIVRLYLFHSSQNKPIKTYDLYVDEKKGAFQWFTLDDCYLPYVSDKNNAGGSWYLVYNQNELPFGMESINVSKDWSRDPCGTCNIGSVETWRELMKYVQISPFKVPAPETFAENPELWDVSENLYTNTMNYGINCEMSVGCDLTDFIVSQRLMFANCIQKQVAAIALRTMAMNPEVRVNRNQLNVNRTDILYELDGNTAGVRPGGLGYELKKAYKALRLDTEGLDDMCLSCANIGVSYGTIY